MVQLKMCIIDNAIIRSNPKQMQLKIKKVNLIVINVLRLWFKSVVRGPRGAYEDILRRSAGVYISENIHQHRKYSALTACILYPLLAYRDHFEWYYQRGGRYNIYIIRPLDV